ncbi:hypothetical protein LXA43DRAFT_1024860 [Ganoderma leucocontextum]|nr:hypothetical protein LXA43DRAFT_1024860 [Ganoderma leucocontextum]
MRILDPNRLTYCSISRADSNSLCRTRQPPTYKARPAPPFSLSSEIPCSILTPHTPRCAGDLHWCMLCGSLVVRSRGGSNVELGCVSPICLRRQSRLSVGAGPFGRAHLPTLLVSSLPVFLCVHHHRNTTPHSTGDPPPRSNFRVCPAPRKTKPHSLYSSTHNAQGVSRPSMVNPPRGSRRSRPHRKSLYCAAKRWTSQRPSSTVACRGRATRTVWSARVALQG